MLVIHACQEIKVRKHTISKHGQHQKGNVKLEVCFINKVNVWQKTVHEQSLKVFQTALLNG